ncbi:MAG: hypothetical protein GKR87_07090 [Kiritimatiellae bacterium]|nr:hypothetical protein [Kiritimatiellia bacterium]
MAKSAYGNTRFIITKHNHPIAALINMDDLQVLDQLEKPGASFCSR